MGVRMGGGAGAVSLLGLGALAGVRTLRRVVLARASRARAAGSFGGRGGRSGLIGVAVGSGAVWVPTRALARRGRAVRSRRRGLGRAERATATPGCARTSGTGGSEGRSPWLGGCGPRCARARGESGQAGEDRRRVGRRGTPRGGSRRGRRTTAGHPL